MFVDIWNARLSEAENARASLTSQIKDMEKQIESLLDRIVDATSSSVISAYETRIDKLERQKITLLDQADRSKPRGHLDDFIEPALAFLVSPFSLYPK